MVTAGAAKFVARPFCQFPPSIMEDANFSNRELWFLIRLAAGTLLRRKIHLTFYGVGRIVRQTVRAPIAVVRFLWHPTTQAQPRGRTSPVPGPAFDTAVVSAAAVFAVAAALS